MSQLTVNKQGPEVFADNDRIDDLDFTTGLREFKPPRQSNRDWRSILALTLAGCVSFVLFWSIYGIWKTVYCWGNHYQTCDTLNKVEPFVFGAVFLCAFTLATWFVVARILAYVHQQRAIANRSNLVLDRFGDQQPADLFNRITPNQVIEFLTQRYEIANNLERSIAPYKIYRSVNSLSLSNTAPQLVEPIDVDPVLKPIPSAEWLQWINNQPHVLLAGATGKGKTVTAKPIIVPRIEAGEQLLIIDPHADHWFGLDVIGGGEDWNEIKSAIEQVAEEYHNRHLARKVYQQTKHASMPVTAFTRLTVVMDEGYLVSLNCNSAPKGQLSAWEAFSEVLTSGARKVNISCIMLSQTANVEDLGISGPLRENFTRIAVDARAIKLMIAREETNHERKQQLYETLIGMAYPATTVVGTSVELLDRTGLDMIPDPVVSSANNWPFVRPINAANGQNNGFRTDGRNGHDLIGTLKALRLSGVTREQARDDLGLVFSNDDWTAAQ